MRSESKCAKEGFKSNEENHFTFIAIPTVAPKIKHYHFEIV